MNYGLALSLKAEKHLEALQAERNLSSSAARNSSSEGSVHPPEGGYGMQYQRRDGEDDGIVTEVPASDDSREDLEEKALNMAIDEVFEESGSRWRPWAANGRSCRLGEIVLLCDSDTIIPQVCLALQILLFCTHCHSLRTVLETLLVSSQKIRR